jgi:hypothetical protein
MIGLEHISNGLQIHLLQGRDYLSHMHSRKSRSTGYVNVSFGSRVLCATLLSF